MDPASGGGGGGAAHTPWLHALSVARRLPHAPQFAGVRVRGSLRSRQDVTAVAVRKARAPHSIPQATPVQVAIAFAPVGQGAQLTPQVARAQVRRARGAAGVEVGLAGEAALAADARGRPPFAPVRQTLLHAPQSSSALCKLTHWSPHSVGAPLPQPVAQATLPRARVQSGAVVEGHLALQRRRSGAGRERSVSHPLAAFWSQSA